jgi:2-polyprenyl-3-methyl-5-hydroxy-6-metoxy-1,4-benzoquinol methylase
MTANQLSTEEAQQSDAFAERLLVAGLGMIDILAVYLGDRLGLYRALVQGGPATPGELASRAGCHGRYVREWLEQQAVTGILEASADADGESRRYSLPAGHADVLLNSEGMNFMSPIARLLTSATKPLESLSMAYRKGGGVPQADYGVDFYEGQGDVNRPAFLHLLSAEWLPSIDDIHARLQADPPARVADIACGVGWSSIGIARGYPKVRVDGLDLDAPSIDLARKHAEQAGVADRVSFEVRDAADPALEGQYDLVTVFEALHDMSQPVHALRAAHGLLAPGGSALIVDERVAEEFSAPGDEVERLMYGWSILVCLANGMADEPSAATGTVMRPATLRQYAKEAGFSDVEVLPIEHLFFRFYRLHP